MRAPPALIALSPGTLRTGSEAAFESALCAAWSAGLRGLVLREPGLTDRAYLDLALSARATLARDGGGWLCVHDRAHLAAAVGADAVHVGWRSLAPRELRAWLPRDIAIGLSTHAEDDTATWRDADYLFHGPVFAVAKAHARAPIGIGGLARAVASTAVPIWALGGLRPQHARAVRESGARGMAVLSGILCHADSAARAGEYLAEWRAALGA